MRAEPRDDAEQVTQALPGEPLAVRSDENGWTGIRTAYDYQGWVRADALDGAVDEEWLVERDGDPVEEACAYPGLPVRVGRSDRNRHRFCLAGSARSVSGLFSGFRCGEIG